MTEPTPVKYCHRCKQGKPAEAFHPDTRRGGLRTWCKSCEADYQRQRREQQRAAAPPPVLERLCPCGSGLSVERTMQTNRSGGQSAGRWPLCDACRKPPEVTRQRYRETHQEEIRTSRKRYREENRERLLSDGRERAKQARRADPEKFKARYREWYQRLRAKILDHYGTSCACCGNTDDLSIDHIGGNGKEHREEIFGNHRFGGGPNFWLWLVENDFPDEYQILCRPCNRSKGTSLRCTLNHSLPGSAGLSRDG